jgi:hypothetical protein
MNEDGEEFSNYINDIIDDKKSKNIKTGSAGLLQTLCSLYDGLLSYIVNYCIQVIGFNISEGNIESLNNENNTSLLSSNDQVLKLLNNELQLETVFFILSVLHHKIAIKPNIM